MMDEWGGGERVLTYYLKHTRNQAIINDSGGTETFKFVFELDQTIASVDVKRDKNEL